MAKKKVPDNLSQPLVLLTVLIITLTLIVPFAAGCGGDVEAPENTYVELLGLVPYTEADAELPVFYTLVDFAAAYKADGVTFNTFFDLIAGVPKDSASFQVMGMGSFITGYGGHGLYGPIKKEYIGYDITCIDAEIQFGNPPLETTAAIGRFDPQVVKDTLSQQDYWPDWAKENYTTEEYRGVIIHSWGSGLESHLASKLSPPHIDQLGRARPLAVTEKYLFYAPSVEVIKQMIDASQGECTSLADMPEYAVVAKTLSDQQNYTVIISDASIANLCIDRVNKMEGADDLTILGTPLKNFLTFGVGNGEDVMGSYTSVILYHSDPEKAETNSLLLPQRIQSTESIHLGSPWNTWIYYVDTQIEDNVLVAKLYGVNKNLFFLLMYDDDILLYHEE